MILTQEEQLGYREEIDYLIEMHGPEYIWGKETTMDKTKGLLRDAPAKLAETFHKFVTNPTVIEINEKLKKHNEKLCEQEAQRKEREKQTPSNNQPRRNKQSTRKSDTLGNGDFQKGFDFGDDHL